MNPETVTTVLQKLEEQGPLDPKNSDEFARYYVPDLHSQYGDVVTALATDIETASGGRHAYLFTGTIGSGKSTELNRLAQHLERKGHYALVFDAREYLNEQLDLGIPDLLMAISLAVWEAVCKMQGLDPEHGQRWNWWRNLFTTEVEAKEVTATVGLAQMKFALRDNATLRARMRHHHQGLLDSLVQEVSEFMRESAETIRFQKQLKDGKKLVLVVDSLEHFGGKAALGQTDDVLNSILTMFNTYARHLQLPDWSVVYSVSPLLPKLSPGLFNAFGMSSTYALTSAHVYLDRSTQPDTKVIDEQLVPLLQKRLSAEGAALFTVAQLQEIVRTSGGDLRDMLRMTRSALLKAHAAQSYPVNDVQLTQTFADLRRPYLPLPKQTRERLQYVADYFDIPLDNDEDWPRIMADLAQKRILQYRNGQEWYGVHPLLQSALKPPERPEPC